MEEMDKQYTETMTRLSSNMEKLTNSIADGFALLKNTLYCPPPPSMYPPSGGYNPGLYPPPGPSPVLHPFTATRDQTSPNADYDLHDPTIQ